MTTLLQEQSLQIKPIPPNLILQLGNRPGVADEIRNYFAGQKVFTLTPPVPLQNLYMQAFLESQTAQHEVLLYLFGRDGEILMKDYTFFRSYDSEDNQIPLTPNGWDLRNFESEDIILSFAFASKEKEGGIIGFHLSELTE